MTTDYRALCAELAEELERYQSDFPAMTDKMAYRAMAADDVLIRARAALAQPEPEVAGPTDEELADTYWDAWHKHLDRTNSVLHSVGLRAVLARYSHQPAPPAEGEVAELVACLRRASDGASAMGWEQDSWIIARAADLLERQAATEDCSATAPVPVPVSERLPGPEDCDAEGRLWAWCKATKEWCLLNRWHYREESERNAPGWASGWPYWLPATSLPLPQGEVE